MTPRRGQVNRTRSVGVSRRLRFTHSLTVPPVTANLERLRAAIEAELALLSDPVGPFESGAAAAYHWMLSEIEAEGTPHA